jgi:hypothetical protein
MEIPKKIFQYWHSTDIPPTIQTCIDQLKEQNPDFEHYLFDEKKCRDFIKKNFIVDIVYAYDSLVPIAYKCDLWRYCILYIYGGVYIDVKFICSDNFKLNELNKKPFYFVKDCGTKLHNLANGFIVTKPQNEYLLKGILQIVNNVKTLNYGNSDLHPTGPELLGDIIPYEIKTHFELYHTSHYNTLYNRYDKYIMMNDRIILQMHNEYYNNIICNPLFERYGTLWLNKNIYNNVNAIIKGTNDFIINNIININIIKTEDNEINHQSMKYMKYIQKIIYSVYEDFDFDFIYNKDFNVQNKHYVKMSYLIKDCKSLNVNDGSILFIDFNFNVIMLLLLNLDIKITCLCENLDIFIIELMKQLFNNRITFINLSLNELLTSFNNKYNIIIMSDKKYVM